MCPHLMEGAKLAEIENQIKIWGKDHPLIKSMIFAEFPEQTSGNMVFNMANVEFAMSENIKQTGWDRRAAVDFSGGGDEQVFMSRHGNKLTAVEYMHEPDSMVLAKRLAKLFGQYELKSEWIQTDNSGLGEVVNDILASFGWNVIRLNMNAVPNDKDKYPNVRSEMFFNLSNRINAKEIPIRRDEMLKTQLSWHKFKIDDKGRLKVLPKDEMPSSPDRADTLAMLYYGAPDVKSYDEYFKEQRESLLQFAKNREDFGMDWTNGMLMEQ